MTCRTSIIRVKSVMAMTYWRESLFNMSSP